jgi:hypothetical protein
MHLSRVRNLFTQDQTTGRLSSSSSSAAYTAGERSHCRRCGDDGEEIETLCFQVIMRWLRSIIAAIALPDRWTPQVRHDRPTPAPLNAWQSHSPSSVPVVRTVALTSPSIGAESH